MVLIQLINASAHFGIEAMSLKLELLANVKWYLVCGILLLMEHTYQLILHLISFAITFEVAIFHSLGSLMH